jgi:hypothetical protein
MSDMICTVMYVLHAVADPEWVFREFKPAPLGANLKNFFSESDHFHSLLFDNIQSYRWKSYKSADEPGERDRNPESAPDRCYVDLSVYRYYS